MKRVVLNAGLGFTWLVILLASARPTLAQKKLKLYGGESHKIFLGCLDCMPMDADAVCNPLGPYGSSSGANSIWNQSGQFGSSIGYYSPWNSTGNTPPAVLDSDGGGYGYFTTNSLTPGQTKVGNLMNALISYQKDHSLSAARKIVCP